jgi:hypothetical protein
VCASDVEVGVDDYEMVEPHLVLYQPPSFNHNETDRTANAEKDKVVVLFPATVPHEHT